MTGRDAHLAITVLLAAKMGLFRDALAHLLLGQADVEAVETVDDVGAIIAAAHRSEPDVVVVDVDIFATNELATLQNLHTQLPGTPIVVLVAPRPAGLLRGLFTCPTLATTLAVIDKNDSTTQLVEAVRSAAQGELVVDATVALAALVTAPSPLSRREQEILRLVADGASNHEISARLHLASGTVRNYLSSTIIKTGARNRVDAARIARQFGWF